VARQSVESHVSFVLEVVGFLAHLYVPVETFVVAPDFVQETPLDIFAAACAGAATVNPAAIKSKTENEEILRSMLKPFVEVLRILANWY
jgi:hypothetical protein